MLLDLGVERPKYSKMMAVVLQKSSFVKNYLGAQSSKSLSNKTLAYGVVSKNLPKSKERYIWKNKEGVLQEKIPKGFGHPILHSKKRKSREDGMKKNCKPLKKKMKQLESMVGKNSQMEQKLAETNSRIDAIQKRLRGVGKGAVKEQEKALETVLANAEKRIRS